MATTTRIFSDIDLSFVPHPSTKDLRVRYDDNAIKNAVKNLILTRHYERPFHSEIGSNVTNMLFELATPATVVLLKQEIADVIKNFEPRVDLQNVDVAFSSDEHTLMVSLIFTIKNTTRPITVQFTLNRTR